MLDTLSYDSHLHSRIRPLHYLFTNVHFVPFLSLSLSLSLLFSSHRFFFPLSNFSFLLRKLLRATARRETN